MHSAPYHSHACKRLRTVLPRKFAAWRASPALGVRVAQVVLQASRAETRQLVEGMQKEVAQQIAGLHQRSQKAVREEVKKEGKRLEAAYEAQVRPEGARGPPSLSDPMALPCRLSAAWIMACGSITWMQQIAGRLHEAGRGMQLLQAAYGMHAGWVPLGDSPMAWEPYSLACASQANHT